MSRGAGLRQRGVALVIGMVFLVALSLTAIIAMNRTILQERMTGAYRSEQMAYAAADAGLRSGEWTLWEFPVVNNLGVPPVVPPNHPMNCLVVCSMKYEENVPLSPLGFFKTSEPAFIDSFADSINVGMVKNSGFLSGGAGSQSAFAPVVYREGFVPSPPEESLGQGRSGLRGELVYYRLTARGYGPTPDIERTLQSTFSLVK